MSRSRAAVLILLSCLGPASGKECGELEEMLAEFEPGELGFESMAESDTHMHVTCYALGGSDDGNLSIVQKAVSEFQRAQVGIASFHPDEDAEYPCENQNSWGQLNLEVMDVNGISAYDGGAESITTSEATCTRDDRMFFDGTIHVTQKVNDHLTIDGYMFRSAAQQEAANLQHTMTIGVMDSCKMELIYAFKPKAGGGLDARVEVRAHAFGGLESRVNAALVASVHEADSKLSVHIPKNRLLEGAGLGPSGCASTFDDADTDAEEMHHLVDVSLSFICKEAQAANSEEIVKGTVTWEGSSLLISLTSDQAPEACQVLYWDPLVTPVSVGGALVLSAASILAPAASTLAAIVGATMATMLL